MQGVTATGIAFHRHRTSADIQIYEHYTNLSAEVTTPVNAMSELLSVLLLWRHLLIRAEA